MFSFKIKQEHIHLVSHSSIKILQFQIRLVINLCKITVVTLKIIKHLPCQNTSKILNAKFNIGILKNIVVCEPKFNLKMEFINLRVEGSNFSTYKNWLLRKCIRNITLLIWYMYTIWALTQGISYLILILLAFKGLSIVKKKAVPFNDYNEINNKGQSRLPDH